MWQGLRKRHAECVSVDKETVGTLLRSGSSTDDIDPISRADRPVQQITGVAGTRSTERYAGRGGAPPRTWLVEEDYRWDSTRPNRHGPSTGGASPSKRSKIRFRRF
ncbi:hypothetical protein GCM10010104_25350 [Streptomyces indiaensis]|uniref:Uncharacterized protein n=1 Tax=Streptomyces indiaensis TaxID=284033 RepID=A0ABN3DGJ0_9ACTN